MFLPYFFLSNRFDQPEEKKVLVKTFPLLKTLKSKTEGETSSQITHPPYTFFVPDYEKILFFLNRYSRVDEPLKTGTLKCVNYERGFY